MALALVRAEETLPKQRRSRERRARMIEHGVEILKNRDLEDVAVAEITGALGYSTGSFYSAFADKAAFFTAVQREANARVVSWIEAEIEGPDLGGASLNDRLALCVDLTLRYFREYRGVMRSAWSPMAAWTSAAIASSTLKSARTCGALKRWRAGCRGSGCACSRRSTGPSPTSATIIG